MKSYEPNRSLVTSVDNRANGVTVSRFDYVNDALGRRIERIDTGSASATNAFAYNPKNEITNAILAANSFGYAYDPIGNRISATRNQEPETYSANSLNQYTSITNGGLWTLGYDLDGNLTRSVTLSGVEWVTNDFTWDAENRLTSVISNGTVIASFKYDYMSRRYEKATAAGTNTFLWDGWLPVQELSNPTTGNSTTNFYVWGLDLSGSFQGAGGIGGLLSVTKSNGTYFPLADANGNITDYVTADGAVVAHREFDAYGNAIVASGAVNDFQFWFSSKYLDAETGLYYYGYRYYSPSLGRWLSRDPFGERGGLDLYAFVINNPSVVVDAFGLAPCCGPDVTDYVKRTLAEVDTEFGALAEPDKKKACLTLLDPATGGHNWDIVPLATLGEVNDKTKEPIRAWPFKSDRSVCRPGSSGGCGDTVAYDGKCYHSRDVNYKLWGRAMSLCRGGLPKGITAADVGTVINTESLLALIAETKKSMLPTDPSLEALKGFEDLLNTPIAAAAVRTLQAFIATDAFSLNFALGATIGWKQVRHGGTHTAGASYFVYLGYENKAPNFGDPVYSPPKDAEAWLKQIKSSPPAWTFSDPQVTTTCPIGKTANVVPKTEALNWRWNPFHPK